MNSMRLISLAAAFCLACGCSMEKGKEFSAPEIISTHAEVDGSSAVLSCTLSGGRVESCGFMLDKDGAETEVAATLSGDSFSATVSGLEIDASYSWYAFARCGSGEVRSAAEVMTVEDGAVPIPDSAFKSYLLERYDFDGDGEISLSEAEQVWGISFCTDELGVKSVKGIEYMPNLESLALHGSWLDPMDTSQLEHFYINHHYKFDNVGPIGTLESIDVSANSKLRHLDLNNNAALGDLQWEIDLSGNPELEEINLDMTYLLFPDLSLQESKLTSLSISHLRGLFPDFSKMPNLNSLVISYEQTGRKTDVDVSNSPGLEVLNVCASAKSISDLSRNPKLRELLVSYNDLTEIDLSGLPQLEYLEAVGNRFRTLDVSSNPLLDNLSAKENDNLDTLYVARGQIIPGITIDRSSEYIPDRTAIVER